MVDYYDILGIKKGATDSEIKKAYKKKALQWHPDKNEDKEMAEKKFKEIAEAYAVLGDEEKKSYYDKFGCLPDSHDNGFSGMPKSTHFSRSWSTTGNIDPNEIFRNFFGEANPFGDNNFFQQKKNEIQQQIVKVSLDELYNGSHKRFRIKSKIFKNSNETLISEKVLEFDIKQGWKDGTKITFEKSGDQPHPTLPQKDIQFVITTKSHKYFEREGNDLIFKAKISLKQALCGGAIEFVHLDGSKKKIPLKGVTTPGMRRTLQNEGMPISKSKGRERGNMHIIFEVVFPEEVLEEDKRKLEKIL